MNIRTVQCTYLNMDEYKNCTVYRTEYGWMNIRTVLCTDLNMDEYKNCTVYRSGYGWMNTEYIRAKTLNQRVLNLTDKKTKNV